MNNQTGELTEDLLKSRRPGLAVGEGGTLRSTGSAGTCLPGTVDVGQTPTPSWGTSAEKAHASPYQRMKVCLSEGRDEILCVNHLAKHWAHIVGAS